MYITSRSENALNTTELRPVGHQVAISVRCGVQSTSTTGQHMDRVGMDLEDPGSEYSVHVFGHVRFMAWEGHVPSSPKRPV